MPEVLVECQADAVFMDCKGEYVIIGHPGKSLANPDNIVAMLSKCVDQQPWNVLVAQPLHRQEALGKTRSSFSMSRA